MLARPETVQHRCSNSDALGGHLRHFMDARGHAAGAPYDLHFQGFTGPPGVSRDADANRGGLRYE